MDIGITHALIHFKTDGERNKLIRSANMLKKELRGRKIKITWSMDAEERFHNIRMGYVKYCIHMKHNVPLESITTNWTMNYVSIKGQIVVKTIQSGNLKYIKYQDVEAEVEEQMQKWQSIKLIATIVSSREKGMRRREEGWTTRSQKTITSQRNHSNERCTSEGGGRDKLKKVDGDFPTCIRKIETIMMSKQKWKTWEEKEDDDSSIAHSSSNMSVRRNENKEARATASAAGKVSEDMSVKDAEILRFIEERRNTSKGEKHKLKEVSKCIKRCIRDKKRMTRQMDIQRILEYFQGIRNFSGIKSAELQMSLDNSTKFFTNTMIKMNLNKN